MIGPMKLDDIFQQTYLITDFIGPYPFIGNRFYSYHIMLYTTERTVYFSYLVDLIHYSCQSYIQSTPVNSLISQIGHSVYILLISLFSFVFSTLLFVLQPFFKFLNVYILILSLLYLLYYHYTFTTSFIYASIVSFVAETLITCFDNTSDSRELLGETIFE